jgi:hypothetical protein
MALLDSPDLFGTTLFCDDIRQEADGKFIFIGVYGSAMLVRVPFPVTLPKFAFGITFSQKRRLFEHDIGLRIFMPGDKDDAPSIQADLRAAAEAVAAAEGAAPNFEDPTEEPIVSVKASLILAPLTITSPGRIKVRIARRDDLIRLGTLAVMAAEPSQAVSLSAA